MDKIAKHVGNPKHSINKAQEIRRRTLHLDPDAEIDSLWVSRLPQEMV